MNHKNEPVKQAESTPDTEKALPPGQYDVPTEGQAGTDPSGLDPEFYEHERQGE